MINAIQFQASDNLWDSLLIKYATTPDIAIRRIGLEMIGCKKAMIDELCEPNTTSNHEIIDRFKDEQRQLMANLGEQP